MSDIQNALKITRMNCEKSDQLNEVNHNLVLKLMTKNNRNLYQCGLKVKRAFETIHKACINLEPSFWILANYMNQIKSTNELDFINPKTFN